MTRTREIAEKLLEPFVLRAETHERLMGFIEAALIEYGREQYAMGCEEGLRNGIQFMCNLDDPTKGIPAFPSTTKEETRGR